VFMGIVPAYGRLANSVGRLRLINICYTIVIACLAAFFVMAISDVPNVGLFFFVWGRPTDSGEAPPDAERERRGERRLQVQVAGGCPLVDQAIPVE